MLTISFALLRKVINLKFRNTYSPTSEFVSESGTPYLQEYEYQVNDKGVQELVLTDRKRNVYDAIQADYDATDINKLMLRFTLGETSAINVSQAFYADVTSMPTTMAEVFNKAKQCEQYFDELPVDLKQMFNNSYTEFFSELNSDEKGVFDKIDKYNERFESHFPDEPDQADVKVGDDDE